jgi:Type IV secretory pathway, VirB11 components, and related ATPases involved in archaeal flagella biosynthesis
MSAQKTEKADGSGGSSGGVGFTSRLLRGLTQPSARARLTFEFPQLDPQVKGEVVGEYVLDEYPSVKIVVSDLDGEGYYTVVEPPLSAEERRALSQIMEELYFSMEPVDEDAAGGPAQRGADYTDYVVRNVLKAARKVGKLELFRGDQGKLVYYISREMGYSIVHPLIVDRDVEEIECNGYDRPLTVVHRRHSNYPRLTTNVQFADERVLRRFVQRLAAKAGKSVNVALPIANFVLPQKHRVAVTFGSEVSQPGTTFDIRKFPEEPLTIVDLLERRMLSPLVAAYVWVVAESKQFVMVVGATGSGKTTLLNSLLNLFNPSYKILTVEDTAELRVNNPNWVSFFTRESSYSGTRQISIEDLVKTSLRYRPDVVVVGEVRGAEIQYLVQAVASGHGGITSFHGSGYQDVATRVSGLLQQEVAKMFQATIASVVAVRRIIDQETGKMMRRVFEVQEPAGAGADPARTIFKWDPQTDDYYVPAPTQSGGADGSRGAEVWAGPRHYGARYVGSGYYDDGSPASADVWGSPQREEALRRSVRALVERSVRLTAAADLLGWTRDRLLTELVERTKLLEDLKRSGIRDYANISSRLTYYYRSRRS